MNVFDPGNVRAVDLEQEMRASYMDYAMSVIVSRALPDVRDGLKPVQRRILYAMLQEGMVAGTRFKKSASIVGEVMKSYHPHGDAPIYDTMVRLTQHWVMRYPLVAGQGNFGSVDGDPPAAPRYTEAVMAPIAMALVDDIEKNTVDFRPTYDNENTEPSVLPSMIPNLLVNGASGIAVGMATNIPPHNLGEVVDALVHLVDDPEATTEDLTKFIKGPDFPTGGIIYSSQIATLYGTGHGRIVMQAQVDFEESKSGREQIIVRELPYQVNKARLIGAIAELVKDGKLDGIADLRDESGRREQTRIVIELKSNARPNTVLNNLYKHTALQNTFGGLMLALVDGRPVVLGVKPMLQHFIDYRRVVITRRTRFELAKARERAHILEGLMKCLDHLDEVIRIIRASDDPKSAQAALEARFELSDRQSKAIVDLTLGRLTRLEAGKLREEYEELIKEIGRLEDILADKRKIDMIVKDESLAMKRKFGDARRTEIRPGDPTMTEEDLIPREEVFVTLTNRGYIKRQPVHAYRAQHRGGKGVVGAKRSNEEDWVAHSTVASTHSDMLFFTNRGKVFRLRTHEIPDVKRQAKGIPVQNLVDIDPQGERVTSLISMASFSEEQFLVMVTRQGQIKKTPQAAYAAVRRNGLIAINLIDKDELGWVRMSTGGDEVLIVSRQGKGSRFSEREVRPMGRDTMGVGAMRLRPGDEIAGFDIVRADSHVLVVTQQGFGKLTPIDDYPVKSRNIQGVYTVDQTAIKRIGEIVGMRIVEKLDEELMVLSTQGQVIRIPLDQVRISGRQTRGVIIMRLTDRDRVGSIAGVGTPEELEA